MTHPHGPRRLARPATTAPAPASAGAAIPPATPRSAARTTASIAALTVLLSCLAVPAAAQAVYWPGPHDEWERRSPEQVGLDPRAIADAVAFAQQNEARAPRDLELAHYQSFGREPFGDAIGPFKDRGDPAGLILRHGYIVAEWGDTHRVDLTFSVTKSFLSTVVGLAYDRGMIRDVHHTVREYMAPVSLAAPGGGPMSTRLSADRFGEGRPIEPFESEHNRKITWDHLLRQTSDWEGTLWGKPDWADRPDRDPARWLDRPRAEPGTVYEYNDVRVNVLALAALNIWRRPLPQVLKEFVMDPIGASNSWRWHGYDNSWVLIDGLAMQAVGGGAHWGGGMWISARDQARSGLLTLRRGRWQDKQILSEEWIRMATTPTPVQPSYGFMNFFLNTGRETWPKAPETAFAHRGAGQNIIYVDPENDLVIVARWIEGNAVNPLIERVLDAITTGAAALPPTHRSGDARSSLP